MKIIYLPACPETADGPWEALATAEVASERRRQWFKIDAISKTIFWCVFFFKNNFYDEKIYFFDVPIIDIAAPQFNKTDGTRS